jgi:hypothetical protein
MEKVSDLDLPVKETQSQKMELTEWLKKQAMVKSKKHPEACASI